MPRDALDYSKEAVLVVDDEESVRGPLVEMLRHLGFRTEAVSSAREALQELQENHYTFLLTDISMPGMDGLELIRRIRSDIPDLCTIAMTGYSKDYNYVDVVNAGATDFVNKPFGIEEFEAKVRRAIIDRNTRIELSRLSITDELTTLYNQRHFYKRLSEEIMRLHRQKHDLALILLDLDDFKAYNDTYGHLAGDDLLRKVGSIIHACIREGVDSGYRYGGDEFTVILIDADLQIAGSIGRRIEKAIERECKITASMGYAMYADGMSPEDLVAEADKDLYRLKGARRNNNNAQKD
jgi:diguanylate cyclase (GGDEF)-like protein